MRNAPETGDTNFAPPPCRDSVACAAALKRHRPAIARALLENLRQIPRWAEEIARTENLDEFAARELHVFVDYLQRYLHSGDESYMHLYIGEKLKQTYEAVLPPEDAAQLRRDLAALDAEAFVAALRGSVPETRLHYLRHHLDRMHAVVGAVGQKQLNILFVQDCLYLDILSFLTAPLLEDRIGINPLLATSKNPEELRAVIRELSKNKIHAVFFSPFTYEFSPDFARLLQWRNGLMAPGRARELARDALADTQKTLDLLAELFDCHVFVHNTAMLIREASGFKRRAKNLLTARPRATGAQCVNQWIEDYVQQKNAATFEHLFVLDETAPRSRLGEHALGALLYASPLQHPAAFGREIAREYRDLLYVEANLLKKKLVVCDLDNTLWEGLIGEGEVRHYADRQQVLKRLRQKGVVLAVNSKNDPANVHWRGCALSEDDFVCAEISWDPKVNGMRRIQSTLNLKLKDYVFIDDRADEREMVSSAFPEILPMDATDSRTWRLLGLWASLLDSQPEMDRTALYRQREERQRFLQAETVAADSSAMFKGLDLRVHIRRAQRGDLKRVVELINRTNQFNLCATRASYGEVAGWNEDPAAQIIVAHAADRFGDMGMVCAAVVKMGGQRLEVPVFVLSCRVFGYGIEHAVMNYIKRLAAGRPIAGWYRETAQNAPCKNFYADNAFVQTPNEWTFEGQEGESPEWLQISLD